MVVAAAVLTAGIAGSAEASPAPTVEVDPSPGLVLEVFGANSRGDVFFNTSSPATPYVGSEGRIRRADGAVVELASPLGGDGAIASDGALWASIDGSLWRVDPDGTLAEHPVMGTGDTASASIGEVEVGPDGRIWFVDPARAQVGSVAADGSGLVVHPVPGPGGPTQLAPGVDGRMWLTRQGGGISAVASDGTVTSYGSLGRNATGLRATALGLYAATNAALVHIGVDGAQRVVRPSSWTSLADVGTADGWAWFASGTEVLAVSPSGRIAPFAIEDGWRLPDSSGGLSLVPDPAGGFVGAYGARMVRVPSAAVNETFSVAAQVVASRGANVLRVSVRATTPGGAPLGGRLDVVLWGTYAIPEGYLLVEKRATVVGRVEVVAGRATADIPITPDLVRRARPGGLLHTSCCTITVRRPPTPAGPGLGSWPGAISGGDPNSYYGPVVPSRTMIWLDAMHRGATGRTMDTGGMTYWAAQLASGRATRISVTEAVVDSAAYRRHRVTDAYQRWFRRAPSSSELSYWSERLITTTTSGMDLALAAKPSARDARGTTNAQRAAHLAAALHLPGTSAPAYAARLDSGVGWTTVVRDAYWSASAKTKRLNEMGTRSAFTPSLSLLGAEWQRTGDERSALIAILATLPVDSQFLV
jgi:hypothetical protein